MATFVVAHGAWSSGWAWKKMRPLLRAAGHDIFTPSYTGLGERTHLAHAAIDLDTHIQDVVATLEFEDLNDVVLLGHSYGGIVATGVAGRARARVAQIVYLDAFVPTTGQSLFDLVPAEARSRMETLTVREGEGWLVPPTPMPPDTGARDAAWATPRRSPHPIAAFRQPLRIDEDTLPPRSYIYCTRVAPGDPFRPFAERARREGWRYFEIDASHNPHITAPQALCRLLDTIGASAG